jgi:predicted HicB family RNase H-like nuclease
VQALASDASDTQFDGLVRSRETERWEAFVMPKLTVRLHDERTGELLGVVAKRYGVSKNQLIEQLLERSCRPPRW